MNPRTGGLITLLAATVALGGATSTTLASSQSHAVAKESYSCELRPAQAICQIGVSGTRVTGGVTGSGPISGTGGTRVTGGVTGSRSVSGTGGTRVNGGSNGNGAGVGGTRGGSSGSGAGANGSGKNGSKRNGAGAHRANTNGAGANGSSPIPHKGVPVTGFGGTAQDLGVSPRAAAAGTQPVVVGLASAAQSQRVLALPATGGGVSPQPTSPLPTVLALGLAVLGLGVRRAAGRF